MSKVDEILEALSRGTISAHNNNYGENIWNAEDYAKLQAKQALYKDLYEIISFSADRGEAYKKLKDYFGEAND
jgi:hypothetical protein